MKRPCVIAIPLVLVSCGTLPQPFLGHPGKEGARLAIPPPPVLMVPSPLHAMLGTDAAALYAHDLAGALIKRDVPSIAHPAGSYDWRLNVTATLSGAMITPEFAILGPNMKTYGHATGTAIPAAAWRNGDSTALKASALEIAPQLARQLAAINAAVQQSNPKSLANRPPRVHLAGVSGAPGDGDHSLALDLTRDLPKLGIVVADRKDDADFVVNGAVTITANPKRTSGTISDLVQLTWTVKTQAGRIIGKVTQLHDLKPNEMAPYWGDVAAAAAKQAALGLSEVITNATPKRPASSAAAKLHPEYAKPVRQPEG